MEEDKKEIVERLTKLIKKTREGQSIKNIVYKKGNGDDEYVEVIYFDRTKAIDVTADSGIAMIRDIVNHL